MDRILNMIIRRVVGRLVNKGMDVGMNAVSRNRTEGDQPSGQARRPKGASSVGQARGLMRMARRLGRF